MPLYYLGQPSRTGFVGDNMQTAQAHHLSQCHRHLTVAYPGSLRGCRGQRHEACFVESSLRVAVKVRFWIMVGASVSSGLGKA